jgi:hypothetical protein
VYADYSNRLSTGAGVALAVDALAGVSARLVGAVTCARPARVTGGPTCGLTLTVIATLTIVAAAAGAGGSVAGTRN